MREINLQATDPPTINNLWEHIKFHMAYGTRPGGVPGRRGKEWTQPELLGAISAAKAALQFRNPRENRLAQGNSRRRSAEPIKPQNKRSTRGDDPASAFKKWRNGHGAWDTPWGFALEKAFFGSQDANPQYDNWRRTFKAARNSRPQELRPQRLPSVDGYLEDKCLDAIYVEYLEGIRANLVDTNWRLDLGDDGQGYTNAALNRELLIRRPKIRTNIDRVKWTASSHRGSDLAEWTRVRALSKGEFRNDPKIRLASELTYPLPEEVVIQETDYLSSCMTDQLRASMSVALK